MISRRVLTLAGALLASVSIAATKQAEQTQQAAPEVSLALEAVARVTVQSGVTARSQAVEQTLMPAQMLR